MSLGHVLVRQEGRIGRLTLSRPKRINALDHGMVVEMRRALRSWSRDDTVHVVVIDGAGDRGLCAGGDIRAIYDDMRAGTSLSLAFWADEYRLNAEISSYPKPVVALMDGLVMGGGVGLSGHASHRVVAEDAVVAMPEVLIGFTPDVGGTYLLAHAPGELGTHAALTSYRMDAADATYCGLADVLVPRALRDDLFDCLQHEDVDTAISSLAAPAGHSRISEERVWIDKCYSADTVEEILDRLGQEPSDGAREAARTLADSSPTALKVTLRALREARTDSRLEESVRREYRVAAHHLERRQDFAEGVRTRLIDRGSQPVWSPATLSEVRSELVEWFFRPLGAAELHLS